MSDYMDFKNPEDPDEIREPATPEQSGPFKNSGIPPGPESSVEQRRETTTAASTTGLANIAGEKREVPIPEPNNPAGYSIAQWEEYLEENPELRGIKGSFIPEETDIIAIPEYDPTRVLRRRAVIELFGKMLYPGELCDFKFWRELSDQEKYNHAMSCPSPDWRRQACIRMERDYDHFLSEVDVEAVAMLRKRFKFQSGMTDLEMFQPYAVFRYTPGCVCCEIRILAEKHVTARKAGGGLAD
jgi:hypothetical protein